MPLYFRTETSGFEKFKIITINNTTYNDINIKDTISITYYPKEEKVLFKIIFNNIDKVKYDLYYNISKIELEY